VEINQHHVQFFTAVCNDLLKLLESDEAKTIIIEALKYRVSRKQVKVCAFVVMPNHIHLIWRIQNDCKLQEVQRDFLKFTAKLNYLHDNPCQLHWQLLVIDQQ
jgi:REP element-mobilizing transposase RayT